MGMWEWRGILLRLRGRVRCSDGRILEGGGNVCYSIVRFGVGLEGYPLGLCWLHSITSRLGRSAHIYSLDRDVLCERYINLQTILCGVCTLRTGS